MRTETVAGLLFIAAIGFIVASFVTKNPNRKPTYSAIGTLCVLAMFAVDGAWAFFWCLTSLSLGIVAHKALREARRTHLRLAEAKREIRDLQRELRTR